MFKYRLIVDTGFAGARHEDVIESETELSKEEILEAARDVMENHIEYWGEKIEDGEDDD